uniref:G2/mitotic-specific cyclin-B2 n=1 Tax=Xiphophorus couchianus TaxID=32473 RepID=A0A3B5LNB3_9TELE
MVSFRKDDSVCDTFCKRRLTPPRQTARHRKQRLVSKLGDSGFEDDLVSSPIPPRCRMNKSMRGKYFFIQYDLDQFSDDSLLCLQLTADARCKLVSWLIPVHKHFRLSFECCCLTVNIMDRFLASTPVATDCFQLLGVTALLLASKQVEVRSPSVSYLLSLCCDTFTKEQFCNLECLVLLRLNFRLASPTLAFFLDYFSNLVKAAQFVIENNSSDGFSGVGSEIAKIRKCSELAQKVCELTLADYAFNKYPPSLIAYQCMQPVCIQSYQDCSLVQECKDNLKMLVSLNQETLKIAHKFTIKYIKVDCNI